MVELAVGTRKSQQRGRHGTASMLVTSGVERNKGADARSTG